jgi:hypothetical protein
VSLTRVHAGPFDARKNRDEKEEYQERNHERNDDCGSSPFHESFAALALFTVSANSSFHPLTANPAA